MNGVGAEALPRRGAFAAIAAAAIAASPRRALAAEPWPGAAAVWRAEGTGPLALHGLVDYPACLGRTLTELPAGPLWRLQRGVPLDVTLRRG